MHAPASRYVCTASGAPALSAAGARPGSDRPGPEPGIEDSMTPSGQAIRHGYMHGLPGSSPPHPGPYPSVIRRSLHLHCFHHCTCLSQPWGEPRPSPQLERSRCAPTSNFVVGARGNMADHLGGGISAHIKSPGPLDSSSLVSIARSHAHDGGTLDASERTMSGVSIGRAAS